MIVFPNAKINIGLHVISRRSDGYHNLETVFYPVFLTDVLEMAETGKAGISFTGIPVEGEPLNNLVVIAYNLIKHDFDIPPIWFHLHKIIPAGAGLGGGSSDAAFTLKLINDYFKLGLDNQGLKSYAKRIGADCSFFIDNTPAFAKGIGDELMPVDLDLSGFQIVLVKPEVSVSTVQAYKNIQPSVPNSPLEELIKQPVEEWRKLIVNDFEMGISRQFPVIQKCKDLLYQAGAVYASMSGSGSAVFGLFHKVPNDIETFLPGTVYTSY